MSDIEKKIIPEDEPESLDDDLDSLSFDEKAAFEKIMAEIAASSGTSPQSSPPDIEEPEKLSALNTPVSATKDEPADPVDDSQHLPKGDGNHEANEPDIHKAETANRQPMSADSPDPGTLDSDNRDQLSEDTQKDDLSDDQQKALEMIMAEIEAKKGKESPSILPPETESPETGDDEQQEDEDDQEAALNKIMAEIAEKKNKDHSESFDDHETGPEGTTESDSETEPIRPEKRSSLSEEEFNDELNQLISSVKPGSAEPSSDNLEEPNTETPNATVSEKTPESTHGQEERSQGDLASAPAGMAYSADSAKSDNNQPKKSRKPAFAVLLVCILLFGVGGGAYWAYNYIKKTLVVAPPETKAEIAVAVQTNDPMQITPETGQNAPLGNTPQPSFQTPAADPLDLIVDELSAAKRHIVSKISEISDLKAYYQKGIDEEAEKIEQTMDMPEKANYEHAIQNKQVELSMRSIQRRMVYIEKLETPLERLKSASEELLYWERRAQLLAILKKGVSGISVEALTQQAKTVIHEHLNQRNHLSIDDIEVPPVALEQIWKQLSEKFKTKARRQKEISAEDGVNQTVGREICQGNFEHKNMLTALSSETAQCLLQWSGKDLYLNELTVLPPAVAKLLAQWPGEWLSMNGLKDLPAESARYLSQWPGKRLSLNGLIKLSPEATAYLSEWKGEQLEMIGLQSIGGWKNYGTRLYLSETLRRRLESQ